VQSRLEVVDGDALLGQRAGLALAEVRPRVGQLLVGLEDLVEVGQVLGRAHPHDRVFVAQRGGAGDLVLDAVRFFGDQLEVVLDLLERSQLSAGSHGETEEFLGGRNVLRCGVRGARPVVAWYDDQHRRCEGGCGHTRQGALH
jgi:hypothetical protein